MTDLSFLITWACTTQTNYFSFINIMWLHKGVPSPYFYHFLLSPSSFVLKCINPWWTAAPFSSTLMCQRVGKIQYKWKKNSNTYKLMGASFNLFHHQSIVPNRSLFILCFTVRRSVILLIQQSNFPLTYNNNNNNINDNNTKNNGDITVLFLLWYFSFIA